MKKYGVRHFALPGNLGAMAMASILVIAKNNIKACCRDHVGFVSSNVDREGAVRVIRDALGSLHDRGEEKTYKHGKCKHKRITQ